MDFSQGLFSATAFAGALALGGCVVITDDVATNSESASGTDSDTSTSGVSASATDSTSGTDSASGTDSDSASGTDSTTGSGSTGGSTTGEETTGTTTGADVCDPPGDVAFDFRLIPEPDEFLDLEYDWLCTVQEVAPYKDGGTGVLLSCTDGDETVSPDPMVVIDAQPATDLVAFSKGMEVRLVYGQSVPWWIERWIRVESVGSGDLLIAGLSGSGLEPSGLVDVFAPLGVAVNQGVCAPEDDFCGTIERLGVDFIEPQGDPPIAYSMIDGTFDIIAGDPGLSTWLVTAQGFVGEIQCTDTPGRWYSIGMVFDGQE